MKILIAIIYFASSVLCFSGIQTINLGMLQSLFDIPDYPSDVSAVPLNAGLPTGWRDCGKAADIFHLKALEITPATPRKGEELKIHISGELMDAIPAGGSLQIMVKLGVLVLVRQKRDFCETLKEIGGDDVPQCPLKAGPFDIVKSEMLPKNIPNGKYTVSLSAVDAQGREIFCVTGQFQITKDQQ